MFEKSFVARKSDVDLNRMSICQTMSNGGRIRAVRRWAHHLLTEIEVRFRAETLYGDAILYKATRSRSKTAGISHRIVRESDQTEMFLARTRWNRIEDEQG
jgi:hypothetical protein